MDRRQLKRMMEDIPDWLDPNNPEMMSMYQMYLKLKMMEEDLEQREAAQRKRLKERQNRMADAVAEEAKRTGKNCFPPDTLIQLQDGTVIQLQNLRIGQKVLSSSSSGKLEYSEVYFFAHSDPNRGAEYIMICTARHKVKMTPDHHIYIAVDGRIDTVPARKVRIGDYILILNKENRSFENERITELTKSTEIGVYAPITMSGTIIVNDVFASCYVDVVPPKIAHPLLWPMRQLYRLSPSLSSWINAIEENETPSWVKWFIERLPS